MTSSTPVLIEALRILARDIYSQDGVPNAALAEASQRMFVMHELLDRASDLIEYYDSYTPEDRAKWMATAKTIGIMPCPF